MVDILGISAVVSALALDIFAIAHTENKIRERNIRDFYQSLGIE